MNGNVAVPCRVCGDEPLEVLLKQKAFISEHLRALPKNISYILSDIIMTCLSDVDWAATCRLAAMVYTVLHCVNRKCRDFDSVYGKMPNCVVFVCGKR